MVTVSRHTTPVVGFINEENLLFRQKKHSKKILSSLKNNAKLNISTFSNVLNNEIDKLPQA